MNNNFKKVFSIILAGIMVFAVTISVSGASSQTETLEGIPVSGSVTIDARGASASTSIALKNGSISSVSADLAYTYIDIITGTPTTLSIGRGGNTVITVSRPNPDPAKYRSWKAEGNHNVSYSGKSWRAKTVAYN